MLDLRSSREETAADAVARARVTRTMPRTLAPAPQRAEGLLRLELRGCRVGDPRGPDRLVTLHQSGCLKLRLPRAHGAVREAVVMNTAGGLTGGDRLALEIAARDGARLRLSTAACEKVYRSDAGRARQRTRLHVDGARLDWLPQETILFDGAALERELEVSLLGGASALLCEAIVLGREAMGESPVRVDLRDRWRVRRDGRLLHVEALRLPDGALDGARRRGALGGCRAFATVLLCREGPVESLSTLADALAGELSDCPTAGVGVLPGRLVARFAAPGARELRRRLLPVLAALGADGGLPAVWHV